MKSIVLLFWLIGANNGRDLLLPFTHYDDPPACVAAAQRLEAEYAQKGVKVRYKCHETVPEETEVDMYGNPIK